MKSSDVFKFPDSSSQIMNEHEYSLRETMRNMEARIKRHITECKREIIIKIEESKKVF